MSNTRSNYPTTAADKLNGTEYTKTAVASLMELSKQGKPQTEQELAQRINDFFGFCQQSSLRPGIEILSAALGVHRGTFWEWCNGRGGKSEEWRNICLQARQLVVCFVEQASMAGHLNPATSCFLLKNWSGYQDSVSIETINPIPNEPFLDTERWRRRFLADQTEGNNAVAQADYNLLPEN